jgi:hypothetical protein
MNSRAVPMRGFTSPKGVLVPVPIRQHCGGRLDERNQFGHWNGLVHRWHRGKAK